MEKENIIISLGGSLIVPNEIDLDFLRKFRNLILKHLKKEDFLFMLVAVKRQGDIKEP